MSSLRASALLRYLDTCGGELEDAALDREFLERRKWAPATLNAAIVDALRAGRIQRHGAVLRRRR